MAIREDVLDRARVASAAASGVFFGTHLARAPKKGDVPLTGVKGSFYNRRTYETQEIFFVELVNVSIIQNVLLTLKHLIIGLENMTLQSLVFVILTVVVVFIVVVWIVFRKW